jgi:F-box interacting protein
MSNRLLPRDLHNEILVRLPAKSLLRFQCVCKSWKSFIRSRRFIAMHVEHSESMDNYVHLLHSSKYECHYKKTQLYHINGSFSEFQKLELPCQIGASDYEVLDCKGLLLFCTSLGLNLHYLEPLILWNPTIRMSITLPPPCIDAAIPKQYCVYGFGFDHTTNDYKVLRMVLERYGFFPFEAELYRLRTGAWETIRGIDNFQYVVNNGHTQALVNGASHWIGYHKSYMATESSDNPEFVVVLFHMYHEELRVMKLPDRLSSLNLHNSVLRVSSGFLYLMEHIQQQNACLSYNAWMMKEYGVVESWTKQFTLDLEGWRFGPMLCFRNNEKILGEKQKRPVLYDPDLKTDRVINLGIEAKGSFFATNTFVESLVLLNEVNALQTCQKVLFYSMK